MDESDKEAGRPFGYGNVDARPPVDGDDRPADADKTAEAAGKMPGGGGESGGGAYANDAATGRENPGGQSVQGYSGGDAGRAENAASTREATRDRTS